MNTASDPVDKENKLRDAEDAAWLVHTLQELADSSDDAIADVYQRQAIRKEFGKIVDDRREGMVSRLYSWYENCCFHSRRRLRKG